MKKDKFFLKNAALRLSVCILAALITAVFVTAAPEHTTHAEGNDKDRVVDNLGLLTPEEEERLEAIFDDYSETLEFDIVLLTTDTLDGLHVMQYADKYFEDGGYGFGDTRDGAIFVRYLNGSEKEVWISTCGTGLICVYDDYIDAIFEELTPDFKAERYYDAFKIYGDMVAESVMSWQDHGEPVDINGNSGNTYYYDEENDSFFTYIYGEPDYTISFTFWDWALLFLKGCIIPTIIGFIIALIATGSMKSKLKSVEKATVANMYERRQSFVLKVRTDNLVRTNTTKTRHVESSSYSGGGRSGGGGHVSSSHHSSGGFSHGGGGRHM